MKPRKPKLPRAPMPKPTRPHKVRSVDAPKHKPKHLRGTYRDIMETLYD